MTESDLEGRASELRRLFDLSFAAPLVRSSGEVEDLLVIRLVGDPYAVRLRDITGIVTKRRVVPVPSAARGLLGLAGIRGEALPVFSLSTLLGYDGDADAPNWMLLCGAKDPIALAFSDFDGHVRVPVACLHPDEGLRATRQYVSEVVATGSGARPVVAIAHVVAAIRDRAAKHRQERKQ
jgi:purine-binding chemotaxis protein CheW